MKRTYIRSLLVFVFASLFLTFSFVSTPAKAAAAATEAPSTHKAVLTTNRAAGTANYTVTGLDLASDTALTINAVNSSTKKTAFTKNITLDETNCKEGTFTGNITLADLKYAFANYTVTVTIGTKTLTAGTADFTIHTAKAGLSITGNTGAAVRTAAFVSKEATGGVLVPGTGNQISIQIWNKNRAESTAVTVGKTMALNANQNWSVDVSKSGNHYGKWGAKAVVTNSNWKTQYTLASTEYNVIPSCTSFVTKKTKGLVILPEEHNLIRKKQKEMRSAVTLNKTACEQCRMCTDLCPRHLLGHSTSPHKMVRAMSYSKMTAQDLTVAQTCCQCNLCEYFSCPAGINPKMANLYFMTEQKKEGIKFVPKKEAYTPRAMRAYRLVPSKRLIAHIGIKKYDKRAPLRLDIGYAPAQVGISLCAHVGAPAEPTVKPGDSVKRGDLIGRIPEGKLGAACHASVDGTVASIENGIVIIRRD